MNGKVYSFTPTTKSLKLSTKLFLNPPLLKSVDTILIAKSIK